MYYEDCGIEPTEAGDIYALGCVAYEVRSILRPPKSVTIIHSPLDLRWSYPILRDIGMGYFHETGARGGEGPDATKENRRRILKIWAHGRYLENDGGMLGQDTRRQTLRFGPRSKALPTPDC